MYVIIYNKMKKFRSNRGTKVLIKDLFYPMHDRHLIADHLGWFKESTQDGKLRTIEDLLKAKGEKVRRGKLDLDGTVEYIE